jgi:hypothetical protein
MDEEPPRPLLSRGSASQIRQKMVHLFSADRASAGQWLAFKQFKSQQFKSALGTFVPV